MMRPLVVVDISALRVRDLMEPLVARVKRGECHVLLPEIALIELSQHETRYMETVAYSLGMFLRPIGGVVFFGKQISHVLKEEAKTGVSTSSRRLIDGSGTGFIRDLLLELPATDGPGYRSIETTIRDFRGGWTAQLPSPEECRERALECTRALGISFTATGLRSIRKSDEELIAGALAEFMPKFSTEPMINHAGATLQTAKRLAGRRSAHLCLTGAILASGLDWLARGGLEGKSAKDLRNDNLDLQYLIPAAITGQIVTAEKRMIRVHDHVQRALAFVESGWHSQTITHE